MRSILAHRHGIKGILGTAVHWLIRPGMIPRSLLLIVLSATCVGQAAAQGRLYWVGSHEGFYDAIFSSDLNGQNWRIVFQSSEWALYDLSVNPISKELCFGYGVNSVWGIACTEDGDVSIFVQGDNYGDDFYNPIVDGPGDRLYFHCQIYCYDETLSYSAILGIDLTTREQEAIALPGFTSGSKRFDFDPATDKVYYYYEYIQDDEEIEGIASANIDGGEFRLLVTLDPDPNNDRGFMNLAIDAARGYVYWLMVENPQTPDEAITIERIRFDGSERETFFSSDKIDVDRMSIPYGGKYLYASYVDKASNRRFIGRLPLDGGGGFEDLIADNTSGIAVYLSTPTIVLEGGPRDGDEGVELTPALNWVEVDGAVSYNLQITEGTDFDAGKSSGLVVDTTGLQDSEFYVPAGMLQPGTSYAWRIQTVTPSGNQMWTSPFSFTTTSTSVGIESEEGTPVAIALLQNYPNPFNPRTRIPFRLEKGGFTTLSIYNVLGQKVATLVAEHLPAGLHEVTWESSGFPSGTYLCRLQAGQSNDSRVLNLIK